MLNVLKNAFKLEETDLMQLHIKNNTFKLIEYEKHIV